MQEIYDLSKQYGFTVIEDASHAIGADYKDTKVGCCKYSDMTVFSFHPVKIITTGEGGMVLTNSEELYKKLTLYRSHCITRDENLMTKEADGPWYYQQIGLGFNYRMTELQAALGLSQLAKVDKFVARRRQLAERYNELLKDLPLYSENQSTLQNTILFISSPRINNNVNNIFSSFILNRKLFFN